MKNKKIAFYIGSLYKGGAERVISNLAEYFYAKGYQVWMITKFIATEEYPLSPGITRVVADITKEEEKGRIQNLFLRIRKLRNIVKEIQPDILVSFIGKNNLMSIAATRGTGIPAVVSVRSNPAREIGSGLKKILTFAMFSMAEGVVLQTTEAKAFFPKLIQNKAVVLQNSLNPEFIRPPYQGEKRKEIVAVGRIDGNKNQRMLVEAFILLATDFPDWKVKLYGHSYPLEERESLEKLVCEQHLEDRILFMGTQQNIPEKIEGASIFVLSSKQEGMPNSLIEAMVLGLAVISTDCPCGGPRDLIVPEENGILIPVDDREALIRELRRLMEDEQLRDKLSKNAVLLKEKVMPERINAQWEKYLEKCSQK